MILAEIGWNWHDDRPNWEIQQACFGCVSAFGSFSDLPLKGPERNLWIARDPSSSSSSSSSASASSSSASASPSRPQTPLLNSSMNVEFCWGGQAQARAPRAPRALAAKGTKQIHRWKDLSGSWKLGGHCQGTDGDVDWHIGSCAIIFYICHHMSIWHAPFKLTSQEANKITYGCWSHWVLNHRCTVHLPMMYKMFVHWWFDWASQPERLPVGRAACLPWPPWLLMEGFQTKPAPSSALYFRGFQTFGVFEPEEKWDVYMCPIPKYRIIPTTQVPKSGTLPSDPTASLPLVASNPHDMPKTQLGLETLSTS